MKQLMPVAVKEVITVSDNFDLNKFYGYLEVDVICPDTIKIPLLPMKDPETGRTIFPRGRWTWTYFSEELKEVIKHGYIITPVLGSTALEMRGAYIFNEYIDSFYDIKSNSKGAQRWIAKMHLNSLYGIFGRKTEINVTELIKTKDLQKSYLTKIINRIVNVTPDFSLIRYVNNVDHDIIKTLQVNFEGLQHEETTVMNNVGISSAVAAYGRIHMMQFKVGDMADHICYTDTDSIFTDKPLPASMLGKGLGLMKDELDGAVIKKALNAKPITTLHTGGCLNWLISPPSFPKGHGTREAIVRLQTILEK